MKMKNMKSEINNPFNRPASRMDVAEKIISSLEYRSILNQTEKIRKTVKK